MTLLIQFWCFSSRLSALWKLKPFTCKFIFLSLTFSLNYFYPADMDIIHLIYDITFMFWQDILNALKTTDWFSNICSWAHNLQTFCKFMYAHLCSPCLSQQPVRVTQSCNMAVIPNAEINTFSWQDATDKDTSAGHFMMTCVYFTFQYFCSVTGLKRADQ